MIDPDDAYDEGTNPSNGWIPPTYTPNNADAFAETARVLRDWARECTDASRSMADDGATDASAFAWALSGVLILLAVGTQSTAERYTVEGIGAL